MNECDMGGGLSTLSNTNGIGNAVPAEIAASTAAEETGTKCIGSGDIFSPKKYGVSKKKGKTKIKVKSDLEYNEAKELASKMNEETNSSDYSIFQMA